MAIGIPRRATGVRVYYIIHIAYATAYLSWLLRIPLGCSKSGRCQYSCWRWNDREANQAHEGSRASQLWHSPKFSQFSSSRPRQKSGINPRKEIKLKRGLFGAEPWSVKTRERIEKRTRDRSVRVSNGLTELCGPRRCPIECSQHTGLHIWERSNLG